MLIFSTGWRRSTDLFQRDHPKILCRTGVMQKNFATEKIGNISEMEQDKDIAILSAYMKLHMGFHLAPIRTYFTVFTRAMLC